jgi:hypothetical protein
MLFFLLYLHKQLNLEIMRKYYWTTKTGQKIDVDLMGENHLRNTLKMIIRNIEKAEAKEREIRKTRFELNGDIAQDHFDQMTLAEYEDVMRYGF